jgi:hypothetical protein
MHREYSRESSFVDNPGAVSILEGVSRLGMLSRKHLQTVKRRTWMLMNKEFQQGGFKTVTWGFVGAGGVFTPGECNVQDSEDTQHMVAALTQLGVEIQTDWEAKEMVVHGCGGRFPNQGVDLFLGNAGTAMRCAATHQSALLTVVTLCLPEHIFNPSADSPILKPQSQDLNGK